MSNSSAKSLPLLPLRNTALLPHSATPIVVGRAMAVAAVQAALASEDKMIVVVAQRDAAIDQPSLADLHRVGTLAIIRKLTREEGTVSLVLFGTERVNLLEVEQHEPYLRVRVTTVPAPEDRGVQVEALQRAVLELATKLAGFVQPQVSVDLNLVLSQISEPMELVYLVAALLPLDLPKQQALLEATTCEEALKLVHSELAHELRVLELRQQIATEAASEMTRQQREYVLRQQLRAIQQELGESDPEHAALSLLRQRLEQADLPEDVRKEAERESRRLERLPSAAPDYQMIRTYLELVLELPWNIATKDNLDLVRARAILDEDHYDLEDIKERILEHLAVLSLNPGARAPILCFVGPPGVGKTSLGQSIARSLGRKFERFSLGGLHDEAELRGHRRTYIGAMPGRLIQTIRRVGANNPLLMLDEVDKIGRDFRGDPAAALLEILDPAQNFSFRDNYLDLPFDLSRVFFITTANTVDTIPPALLDRMEVLYLAGYTDEEKLEIARRYIIPRQLREAGLTETQLEIPDKTVRRILSSYTREAGVRQLERTLSRLCRKVALRVAEGSAAPGSISIDDLIDMLGPERFFLERGRESLPPGVATGLAWTEAGGDVLYVEAALLEGGRGLTLTGHLGEVMQESAKAAQSCIWSLAPTLGIKPAAFRSSGLHIHVPAGATPKDGPSAGATIAAALASLYTGKPVRYDTAMTGEITLTGLILPVGGIKEKVLAAKRAGISRVILPQDNEQDLRRIPEAVRQVMEFVLVRRVEDLIGAAIPALSERLSAPPRSQVASAFAHH